MHIFLLFPLIHPSSSAFMKPAAFAHLFLFRSRSRSVARRVTAIGIAMMALILLILSWVVSHHQHPDCAGAAASPASPTPPRGWSPRSTPSIKPTAAWWSEPRLAFARYFAGTVELDTTTTSLTLDGQVLNAHFGVVDQFSEDTGGVATIFARQGDDFVRISTSLRNLQGERVMHTLLDRNHPAYARMLSRPLLCRTRQLVWQTLYDGLPCRCATPPVTWWAFCLWAPI